MLLLVIQWICHCVHLQIDSVGVFVWALAPFFGFCCFLFAVCFAVSAGETQVWLGICGSSLFVWLWFSCCCFNRFADSKDFLSLYRVLSAYSHVRTEPLARHRPHSRKKKQCTGLGGGELDEEWDVLLACKKEAHVYGPSLSKQDDWNARAGTIAGTAHTQEYLLLHIAMFPIGAHTWCHVLGVPDADQLQAQIISRAMKLLTYVSVPLPRRIGNRHGQGTSTACDSLPNYWLRIHWSECACPPNSSGRVSQINRLHGRFPLHSRAQCRLVCRNGMGNHPC